MGLFRNLTFGNQNHLEVDINRMVKILMMLGMTKVVEKIKSDLWCHPRQPLGEKTHWQAATDSPTFENSINVDTSARCGGLKISEIEDSGWMKRMSSTDLNLIHHARAFNMNPEVMILQRPLRNYYSKTGTKMLEVMKAHVRERGLGFNDDNRY